MSYHLVNILLHLLNTFLVYVLMRRVLEDSNSTQAVEMALLSAASSGSTPCMSNLVGKDVQGLPRFGKGLVFWGGRPLNGMGEILP